MVEPDIRKEDGQRFQPLLQAPKPPEKGRFLLKWQNGDMQLLYRAELSLSEKDQINYEHDLYLI